MVIGMITVENLTDNGDVSFSLKRDEFYTICLDLTTRLQGLLNFHCTCILLLLNDFYSGYSVGG